MRLLASILWAGLAAIVSAQNSTYGNCSIIATHTVVSGDTLNAIASSFNVTLAAIVYVNPQITNPNFIDTGEIIAIPTKTCNPPALTTPNTPTATCVSSSKSPTTYTVVAGDTFFIISTEKLNITLDSLIAANPQVPDPNNIDIGEVLNVPICSDCVVGGPATYTVVSGDTFDAIAAKFNISSAALQAQNPQVANINFIEVGQVLNLPVCGEANPVPTSTTPAAPQPTAICVSSGKASTYTVVAGDTFFIIATEKLGITLDSLIAANPQVADPNKIEVGQVLNVPICGSPTSSASPSQTSGTTTTPKCKAGAGSKYTVKKGDTFDAIAESFGITVASLAAANPQVTDIDFILDGQVLNIPSCASATQTDGPKPTLPTATCAPYSRKTKSGSKKTYTVVAGDTFYIIATKKLGITLEALIAANPQVKDPTSINIGQVLNVPVCPINPTTLPPYPTAAPATASLCLLALRAPGPLSLSISS